MFSGHRSTLGNGLSGEPRLSALPTSNGAWEEFRGQRAIPYRSNLWVNLAEDGVHRNSFLCQGAWQRYLRIPPFEVGFLAEAMQGRLNGKSCQAWTFSKYFTRPKSFWKWRRATAREANAREVWRRTLQRFLSLERVILAEAIWRRIKPLPLYTLPDSSLVVPQMLTFAQQREVVNDWCL